jgi:flagellar assembly protein FliH
LSATVQSGGAEPGAVVLFEYPADPETVECGFDLASGDAAEQDLCAAEAADGAAEAAGAGNAPEVALRSAELEERLMAESERAFAAGLAQGREEGRRAEREDTAARLAAFEQERRRQAAALMESFAAARDGYLARVEEEVVALALAVAARILRREAQMDPLLLTGAVRVALGQLGATTRVRLRVPGEDLALWKEAMALVPNLTLRPEIEAGEEMRLGDCAIETELGSVDLGIRAQLAEIERGFFDRAGGRRPLEMEGQGEAQR